MHLDFKIPGNITDLQRDDLVLGPLLHKAKKQEQEIELDIKTRDHMVPSRVRDVVLNGPLCAVGRTFGEA